MAGITRRLHRRSPRRRRHQGRLSAAGAGTRSHQGRARQRHGRRGRKEGHPRPLQRDRRQLLRRDRRRDDRAAGRDRRAEPVGPRHPGRAGAGRAALPAGRCRRDEALRRRKAPRRADALLLSKPDILLLDEPTNHLDAEMRRLAGALPQGLHRLRHPRDPRPLLPRQRHRLDARTRSRPGRALQGQLLELAGTEGQARSEVEKAAEEGRQKAISARVGMDPLLAQGPSGQVQGAYHRLRQAGRAGGPRGSRQGRILRSRQGRASAAW